MLWNKNINPDDVQTFDEVACKKGGYGTLKNDEFMNIFMAL